MYVAFPRSDYYEDSVLLSGHRPTTGLAAATLAGWRVGARQQFPCSPCTGWRGRCPAVPRQPRHEYAAGFPRGHLVDENIDVGVASPESTARRALLPGPYPPGWSRFSCFRGFNHWFIRITPFRLACRTRVVWQCRPVPSLSGLLPPSPASPGSGCPLLHPDCCDSPEVGPFIPPGSWRLMAHAFVLEADPGLAASGVFFTRGQSSLTQRAMASSSRSTARRAGRWRLQPI